MRVDTVNNDSVEHNIGSSPYNGSAGSGSLENIVMRWLSVAESQICALEVISGQIPKVRELLEESVESMSSHFSILATSINDQNNLLSKIADSENSDDILAVISNLQKNADVMNKELSSCIVKMQFQDRISQNLVIAENVIKEVDVYLKSSIEQTLKNMEGKSHIKKILLDKEFASTLMRRLTLGELQHKFAEHLLGNGYIENTDEIGLVAKDKESSDAIELF